MVMNSGGIYEISDQKAARRVLMLGNTRLLLAKGSPCILRRREYALLHRSEVIQGGSDVQREHRRAIWLRRRRVVVDHVADLFPRGLSFHYPVVTVERGFRAMYGSSQRQ